MKVAVAGFQHETNRFSPIPTTIEDFVRADSWPELTEGEKIFEVFRDANIGMGGFLQYAQKCSKIIPILWASAEPAGLIRDNAFDLISEKILDGIEAAMPLDGIYLDLHGAMVTETFEDGEGEVLRRLRNRLGREIPVAVSLDLHANITPEMVDLADVMTIFRTYPHLDMAKTGYRAGELLHEIIENGRKPYAGFGKIPFMMPLHTQCTYMEPCRSLYGALPELNSLKTGTADIALGFPPSDIYQNGPAVVAYDFSETEANRRVGSLVEKFLRAESSFSTPLHSPRDAIRLALEKYRGDKPVILADVQDSAGAGTTSDTTGVLSALAEAGVRNTALAAMFDRDAVEAAHELGIGGEFNCVLGGKLGDPRYPGFDGTFRIAALGDGRFDYHGEMMSGVTANIGRTAALDLIGGDAEIRIVVTSERFQALDQAIFFHLGIKPAETAILVLKSTIHFRADFEAIASDVILVEAPGLHPCRLTNDLFTRLRPGVRLL